MSIHIDFETRSAIDLRKSGVWRYAEDESTSVLCLAYRIDNDDIKLWVPGESKPQELVSAIQEGKTVKAFNVAFEKAIWRKILVKHFWFPDIPNKQWSCVAAKCSAQALPRKLEDVADALDLIQKKDLSGKRVMLKLSKPRKITKRNKSLWYGTREDYLTLFSYCRQDVEVESLLDKTVRDLSPEEFKLWQLDQLINERGISVDMQLVNAALKIAGEYTEDLVLELSDITGGAVTSGLEIDRIVYWLENNGLSMLDLTKDSVAQALANPSLNPQIKRVLEIRQELSKTSTKKYAAIKNAVCEDGRLRNLLMYHGASTGRWTGMTVQPQNFPRSTFKDINQVVLCAKRGDLSIFRTHYPDVMSSLSMLLRSVFIPSRGHTMYGGDYSAIEARVLFWLAGEKQGLKIFESKEDIYVDLAKIIYASNDIDKAKRDLGKRGILGCGYAMGPKKFKDTCATFGSVISDELAQRVITAYRDKYYPVVRFWYSQENAAIEAVLTKKIVTCGKITWGTLNDFLYAKLPSGRCLAYYRPRILLADTPWGEKKNQLSYMAVNSETRKWERERTYGGKIAENLTQAVARDLMAHAMTEAENHGYKVLLSVHDELITEALTSKTPLISFESVMLSKPNWAGGLPIAAETWSGERYCK